MNTPNDPKGAAGALKTPLGLIPPYAMEQTAWVHKLGSDKYGPYNWRKTGVCASTYVNAIMRHLNAWRDGENLDPESGISHLAHVACSCNILLDADYCGTLQDDRNVTPFHPSCIKQGYWVNVAGNAWEWTSSDQESRMDKPTPIKYTVHRTEYRILEVGELIQEGDEFYVESVDIWFPTNIVNMLVRNTNEAKYRRKVEPVETPAEEPEQPVETEYRFLKEGETIQEGDEYYGDNGKWYATGLTGYRSVLGYTAPYANVYRRKDERNQECTCGRIKINHHTLGWICEDCEWHGEPY